MDTGERNNKAVSLIADAGAQGQPITKQSKQAVQILYREHDKAVQSD
jgi:hypothetical protein